MEFRKQMRRLISVLFFLAAMGPLQIAARAQSSAATQSSSANAANANAHHIDDQQIPPGLYANLQWRCIGPFRGGRTVAATGIPGNRNLFYIGVNNGGVWKTTDAGRTWVPIFDDQPTGSIGALAVAPSNADIIYVGSGEGLRRPDLSTGDGIYKSSDGGKTWQHLGLRDGQQITNIIVDPQDPNRVFVAVLGHPYGPNSERGVFRSTDGGETWHELTKGLPTNAQGLGRIGFGISPSNPNRIYTLVDAAPEVGGLYRSDDAGESWQRVNHEERIWGRGSDFAWVRVSPENPDIIYICNTSTYRSTDAGANFTAIKGAPGGDDYHSVWINPE